MSLATLQTQVAAFVAAHGLTTSVELRLLDLVSEVGELAKEPLRATGYGSAAFSPTPAWTDELGDVLFALVCLANATNVDLHAALLASLRKYEARLRDRGSAGSGRAV